jgi:beta-phosphoglucomutase
VDGVAVVVTAPEAIIFDLDGVLADTVEFHYRAWKHIADLLDVPFGPEDMNRLRGRQRRDCLLDLLHDRLVDEAEISRLMILKDEFYLADLEQMTPASLLPGVLEFVLAAKRNRLRLGVASASMTARAVLQKTGLLNYMDVVADGGTVARSKPAPDIFIWAAGALRVRPRCAIVFEDSQAGVEAARTAGMFVVGVGDGYLTAQAHFSVPSLRDVALDDLMRRFEAHFG